MNLSDFEYLEQSLDTRNLYGSDSSIANMFLLQQKYNTRLTIKKNILFRYYFGPENRTGYAFPIPLGQNAQNNDPNTHYDYLRTALEIIFEDAATEKLRLSFCLITQEQKNLIDDCMAKYFPGKKLAWKTERDDCDYIYLQKNLAELPGSSYQKKRNHVSRFNRTYGTDWFFKTYPEHDIAQDIICVAEKWFTENNGEQIPDLQLEHQSIITALQNTALLRLRGGVLYIGGKPAAMTLAAPISDCVLDVIYEKAVEEHEKNGAYAVINNQFAKTCGDFLYLNREEDMGIEGLRKAKLSYKPTIILDKFYAEVYSL